MERALGRTEPWLLFIDPHCPAPKCSPTAASQLPQDGLALREIEAGAMAFATIKGGLLKIVSKESLTP
jgi:hypothetical protein